MSHNVKGFVTLLPARWDKSSVCHNAAKGLEGFSGFAGFFDVLIGLQWGQRALGALGDVTTCV